ncbi:hypothetical protein NFH98_20930 [Halomonas sp. H33-56]|uniref:hypothetical protein n=1 Tax=Halomonas sp. H33-56 TaxID=2950873 RepID=UPI0032DF6391
MTHSPLTPAAGCAPVTPPSRQLIYRQCRQSAALAAGIASMANRAVDEGGASELQMEHLSDLSDHLVERLEALAAAIAEACTPPPQRTCHEPSK